jgi:hypothetical protein
MEVSGQLHAPAALPPGKHWDFKHREPTPSLRGPIINKELCYFDRNIIENGSTKVLILHMTIVEEVT